MQRIFSTAVLFTFTRGTDIGGRELCVYARIIDKQAVKSLIKHNWGGNVATRGRRLQRYQHYHLTTKNVMHLFRSKDFLEVVGQHWQQVFAAWMCVSERACLIDNHPITLYNNWCYESLVKHCK